MAETIRFEDWDAEQMQDPEFREATESMEAAFQVANMRMMRGLNQRDLANLVGTWQPSIARIESGKSEPRLAFLRRIAKALRARLILELVPEEEFEQQEEEHDVTDVLDVGVEAFIERLNERVALDAEAYRLPEPTIRHSGDCRRIISANSAGTIDEALILVPGWPRRERDTADHVAFKRIPQ